MVKDFLSDPIQAADELGNGWEHIRNLRNLPKPPKPLKLVSMLEFFLTNNNCTDKEKRQIKKAFNDFISITGKRFIGDISEDDLFGYRDLLIKEYNKQKLSDTWINGRFSRVKTVLKFYLQNKRTNGNKQQIKEVLDHCQILKKQDNGGDKISAKRIDKKVFNNLLKHADDRFKLISSRCGKPEI